MIDARRFGSLVEDDNKLVIYDQNHSQRNTALGVWKRRWAVLTRWRTKFLINTRAMHKPFVLCEQELLYCGRLQDATDAKMKVAEKDTGRSAGFSIHCIQIHISYIAVLLGPRR